jgi:hypothetical protein
MSDPLRTDPLRAADAAPEPDRDAKIEQLLLLGLDHYFAADYEQAINVWSRALFLDRSHARARAYIERARSALAERQRESEELLQNGLAAFRRGDGDEARRLLEAAISQGAPRDEALAVIDRLNRLEPTATLQRQSTARPEVHNPTDQTDGRARRRRINMAVAIAGVAAFAAASLLWSSATVIRWRALLGLQPAASAVPAVTAATDSRLAVPLRGERALARARALAASGHLHDALSALDAVRPTDLQKADADQLRAEIQRQLIGLAAAPARPTPPPNDDEPLP